MSSNNIIINNANTTSNNSLSSDPSNDNLLYGAFKKINKNKQGPKDQQYDMEKRRKFCNQSIKFALLGTCINVLGDSHHKCTCVHVLCNNAVCQPVAKWCATFTNQTQTKYLLDCCHYAKQSNPTNNKKVKTIPDSI